MFFVYIQAFGTTASKSACKNTAARGVIDAVKKVGEHLNKSNVMKVRDTKLGVKYKTPTTFNAVCCIVP